jgi:hypothetical protein
LNRFSPSFITANNTAAAFRATSEFVVTSPNISTTSSGYSTAEDSCVQDVHDSSSSIKSTKASIKKESCDGETSKISSPKKSVPTDLSVANLLKPTVQSQQVINWNHMVMPTENVYEMATRILFTSVKWARTQRSFLSLPFSDQAVLLEDGWSDLFILTAAETKLISNESKFFVLFFWLPVV